ncbi:unnamed protein product [Arctogadus glacialis]
MLTWSRTGSSNQETARPRGPERSRPPGPRPPDCSPGSGGLAGPPPGALAVDLPSLERTFQKDVPNAAFKERRVLTLRVRPGLPSTAALSSDASFPVPTATSLCSFTTNNHLDFTTLVCCRAFGLALCCAPPLGGPTGANNKPPLGGPTGANNKPPLGGPTGANNKPPLGGPTGANNQTTSRWPYWG